MYTKLCQKLIEKMSTQVAAIEIMTNLVEDLASFGILISRKRQLSCNFAQLYKIKEEHCLINFFQCSNQQQIFALMHRE